MWKNNTQNQPGTTSSCWPQSGHTKAVGWYRILQSALVTGQPNKQAFQWYEIYTRCNNKEIINQMQISLLCMLLIIQFNSFLI